MSVVWEDPPEDGRRLHGDWRIPLQENPGRWARLPVHGANRTAYTRRHPDYEFVNRTIEGKSVLYGRYIGNEKGSTT